MAYCLIDIFDQSMNLRYGERKGVFFCLQESIIRIHPDESIFAWTSNKLQSSGLLAPWPDCQRIRRYLPLAREMPCPRLGQDAESRTHIARADICNCLQQLEYPLRSFQQKGDRCRSRNPVLGKYTRGSLSYCSPSI